MKTLIATIALVPALAGCSTGHGSSADRTIDVDALASRHDDAWNQHDAEAMVALFTEDATLVTPSGTRAEGRSELLDVMSRPSPTNETTSATRFEAVQWLTDDLVLLDGVQTLDGPGVERMGGVSEARVVAIARRDGDRWHVVAARPYVPASN